VIAGYISSQNDRALTLGKGATVGPNVRKNDTAYRSSGDIVSLLNANSKHTKTLKNENVKTGILPIDTQTSFLRF
jgi:hypothetical protein